MYFVIPIDSNKLTPPVMNVFRLSRQCAIGEAVNHAHVTKHLFVEFDCEV
jgi:hypothetical protein